MSLSYSGSPTAGVVEVEHADARVRVEVDGGRVRPDRLPPRGPRPESGFAPGRGIRTVVLSRARGLRPRRTRAAGRALLTAFGHGKLPGTLLESADVVRGMTDRGSVGGVAALAAPRKGSEGRTVSHATSVSVVMKSSILDPGPSVQ